MYRSLLVVLAALVVVRVPVAVSVSQPTPGDFIPRTEADLAAAVKFHLVVTAPVRLPSGRLFEPTTDTARTGQWIRFWALVENRLDTGLSLAHFDLEREHFRVLRADTLEVVWDEHWLVPWRFSLDWQHFGPLRWDGFKHDWFVTDNFGNPLPPGPYLIVSQFRTLPLSWPQVWPLTVVE